jgi:CrcB protein
LWIRFGRAVSARRDLLAVIAIGGAIGSVARWSLMLAMPHAAGAFAWSTWVANVSGCFLIGVLMVFVIDVWPPSRYVRPFLGVGILGGYTTFSTYMLDARAMLVAGRPALAGAYLFGSLFAGLLAVWVAVLLTRTAVALPRMLRRRRLERARPGAPTGPDRARFEIERGSTEGSRRMP